MAHYYDEQPSGPLMQSDVLVRLFGKEYRFTTASGLFSKGHVDVATRLLIERCVLDNAHEVLDLGCGWGVVGIMLKLRHSELEVTCSDINSRALAMTKKNARRLDASVAVVQSDIFKDIDKTFDTILTNPPYVAGRAVCFRFIEQSHDHLRRGGTLQLVARHNKGGKVLSQKMEDVFGNVEPVAISSGFRIYLSKKT